MRFQWCRFGADRSVFQLVRDFPARRHTGLLWHHDSWRPSTWDQLSTLCWCPVLELFCRKSLMRLNLETEESSNMEPKQHHLPTIILDAHGKATTHQQKWFSADMIHVRAASPCVWRDLQRGIAARFAVHGSNQLTQVSKVFTRVDTSANQQSRSRATRAYGT